MINYFQIQRLASEQGVPEEIIEKDYLIELVLFYLAKEGYFKEKLIFRGATALKKVYYPDYRFSEDLDFLLEDKENLREHEQKLGQLLLNISSEYPFQLNKRSEFNRDRLQFFISYEIIPEIRAIKELKVDILKDNVIPSYQRKKILFSYPEFKEDIAGLNTYILESVISDKICRIFDADNEPRDLYDLWYLLRSELDVAKIKKELERRYGYDIYIANLLTEIAREDYKRNWKIRLERQVGNLPAYEVVIKELKESIEKKLIRA